MVTVPCIPFYAVSVRRVRPAEIGAVQVSTVTIPVPPGPFVFLSAVTTAGIIITVLRAEWTVVQITHTHICLDMPTALADNVDHQFETNPRVGISFSVK